MERDERNIYIKGITLCAVFIILAVYLYTLPVRAENSVLRASESQGDKDITESEKIELRAVFDDSTGSGMPCDNPEQFERWLETYEQEQEAEHETETQPTTVPTEECEVTTGTDETTVTFYSVNGETLNPELQAYLYQRLADHGIEWFMPYAVMIAYQESHFDCTAVNQSNLRDMGLFQFRINYYPGQDIFNPYEQIDIFTEQMANRANSGRTVSEMISAHNVSDYGGYNQTYVDQVLSHGNNLREVK